MVKTFSSHEKCKNKKVNLIRWIEDTCKKLMIEVIDLSKDDETSKQIILAASGGNLDFLIEEDY